MGTLFDRFSTNVYENEADVVARFLVPLLTEFLGYQANEILPERNMPALSLPLNRRSSGSTRDLSARPDIVLTVDNGTTYAGACDAKHPDEELNQHLDQLRAYANALETTNLLLITNGSATYLFHGNVRLIQSESIEQLDLQFDRLAHIFSRERVAKVSEHDRLVTLGIQAAIPGDDLADVERRHSVDVSDFRVYLRNLAAHADNVLLPRALREALGDSIVCISPAELHTFEEFERPSKGGVAYEQVLPNAEHTRILLVGESGIGKSVLFQQFCAEQASLCLKGVTNVVPIPVRLASSSSARTMEVLALDELASRGSPVTADRLRQLMSQGRVSLILDGLDEVVDDARTTVARDLAHLARTFPRIRLLVSTRPQWLPNGLSFLRYSVVPLADAQVRRFLASQTGLEPSDVLAQLRLLHVEQLATNTLLLSLMCALLKQRRAIPSTKNRLLSEIVRVIERYEDEKQERGGLSLPWSEKRTALGRLALIAVGSGETYAVSREQTVIVLEEVLEDLESRRQVRSGSPLVDLENELLATGFVSRFDGGYVFWHRAFAEHFAIAGLTKTLEGARSELAARARERRWSEVLPAAIAGSTSADELVQELATLNVFAAGAALAESDGFDATVVEAIVAQLSVCCHSAHGPVRDLATRALSRISSPAVEDLAHRLLNQSPLGVQFWALIELARRSPSGARPLIEHRLDWDEFDDDGFRHASEVVTNALEELGTAWAQETLLARWRARDEHWFGAPIASAFSRLAHRGVVLETVATELLSWFCSDSVPYQTAHNLAKVVAALNTPVAAQEIASRIRRGWEHEKDQSHTVAHVEALESLTHESASEMILSGLEDHTLAVTVRRRFAQALTFSRAPIDVERVRVASRSGDAFIRACALDRLAGFGWQAVEKEARRALTECQRASPDGFAEVDPLQSRCVLVLARHDRLQLLAEPELQQERWFRTGLSNLLDALVEQPSGALVPLLHALLGIRDTRLRARLAVALASAGEFTKAKEVRDALFDEAREDYTESNLLDGLEFLPQAEALEWAKWTWNASQAARASMSGFMLGKYLEALEHIGSPEARDEMLRVIEKADSGYGVASGLSHLRQLTTVDLQGWLIAMARKRRNDSGVQAWCMTLIGLGGDLTSEAFVTEGLTHRDPIVRRNAFQALSRLHERQGRLWYGPELEAGEG